MKILFAAGGTGGHINPALAIANHIKKEDKKSEILFAGSPAGMEAELVPKAGYNFMPILIKGFKRKITPENFIKNLDAFKCLALSGVTAKRIINDFKPDIVFGTGGYVSGPIVRSAVKMGIKTAIHEQNAYPGVTNKILARMVDAVFLSVEETRKYVDKKEIKAKIEIVGNPVRESIIFKTKNEARKELDIDENITVFSFGGSLGAAAVSKIAVDIMEWQLNYKKEEVNHIHGYGRMGEEVFYKLINDKKIDISGNKRIKVKKYIDNIDSCYAAADLVICRSGAGTLSELQAAGRGSILIPYPNAAENHQFHNAMVLKNNGAAIVIEEKNYDKKFLFETLDYLCGDKKRLELLGQNASKLAVFDTAQKIYDTLVKL